MLWLILIPIISIVMYLAIIHESFFLAPFLLCSLFISIMAGITVVIVGFTFYPDLVGSYKKVQALEQYIAMPNRANSEDMDNLVNFKRPLNPSSYVKFISLEKAEYNSNLAKGQLYHSNPIYYWMWIGAFIPNDIMQMKPLK